MPEVRWWWRGSVRAVSSCGRDAIDVVAQRRLAVARIDSARAPPAIFIPIPIGEITAPNMRSQVRRRCAAVPQQCQRPSAHRAELASPRARVAKEHNCRCAMRAIPALADIRALRWWWLWWIVGWVHIHRKRERHTHRRQGRAHDDETIDFRDRQTDTHTHDVVFFSFSLSLCVCMRCICSASPA